MSVFFNDTATTEIYTLSLHDALPILLRLAGRPIEVDGRSHLGTLRDGLIRNHRLGAIEDLGSYHRREGADLRIIIPDRLVIDRKSTRLNSSHANISYAAFCLKKQRAS